MKEFILRIYTGQMRGGDGFILIGFIVGLTHLLVMAIQSLFAIK